MNVTGVINATEAGCPPRRGNGNATEIDCCNHGGGSYGGRGISGTPNMNDIGCQESQETCDKGIHPPFGNKIDMVAFQGSGGAGSNGASGGGAIWLHTSKTLSIDAVVEAKGGNARTIQDSTYGDGGGSGGAISVSTTKIRATPDTVLSVAGGYGNFGGGGGSGGWVYGIINDQVDSNTAVENTIGWSGIFNLSAGLSHNRNQPSRLQKIGKSYSDHIGSVGHDKCSPGLEGVF